MRQLIYTIICLKSVNVRKVQVAILARLPREMSQTDRILPRYTLSRVRISFRPRIFYTRKNRKPQSPGPPQSITALRQINNSIGTDITPDLCTLRILPYLVRNSTQNTEIRICYFGYGNAHLLNTETLMVT